MSLELAAPRSAVIIKWPLTFDVTLEIDPMFIAEDTTVGIIGVRLVRLGGELAAWKYDSNRRPTIARFNFSTPAARNQFVADALEIQGVTVAAEQYAATSR
jgi:hypothetical protein